MYGIIKKKLTERKKPVNVCIVGCGWFGGGLIRELLRIKKISPRVIISKSSQKSAAFLSSLGVSEKDILFAENLEEFKKASSLPGCIISTNIDIISGFNDIDVVFEATGDPLAGAKAALNSINKGIDFVTVNVEMDATIGLAIAKAAEKKGVIYSLCDGDQPGCLSRLINEVASYGLEPRIAGNCKRFLDVYQTPEGVKPFVPKGQNPFLTCSFADGTKQAFELASAANAFGFSLFKRGMIGLSTKKQDLIKDFDSAVNLKSLNSGYVDFVMGINGIDQEGGIFVIARSDDEKVRSDLKYLKKGDGPFYLFFRDHHLCYFESASSIAEAALLKTATMAPKEWRVDVIAVAKRDIKKGQKLDGIGGFDCYGVIEKADISRAENLLPMGLAGFATAKADIKKDSPITYSDVILEDNIATQLRKEQDSLFK